MEWKKRETDVGMVGQILERKDKLINRWVKVRWIN
jgi:hypothetical protein